MQPLTRILVCLSLVVILSGVVLVTEALVTEASATEAPVFQFGTRTLEYKDEGPDVAILQCRLQEAGYYEGRIDGLFGKKTLSAVIELQKANKLKTDGIVGPRTYEVLPDSTALPTRGNFTHEELIFLARVIHAEARGESFKGQVAVGAVIINRVQSDLFPNSVREVILQEGQFCTLVDGQVNLYPSQTAIEAAKAAILSYDPTYGALFFYNPKTAAKKNWVAVTRPKATRIGSHVFAW